VARNFTAKKSHNEANKASHSKKNSHHLSAKKSHNKKHHGKDVSQQKSLTAQRNIGHSCTKALFEEVEVAVFEGGCTKASFSQVQRAGFEGHLA
jgi:hypothetical protein